MLTHTEESTSFRDGVNVTIEGYRTVQVFDTDSQHQVSWMAFRSSDGYSQFGRCLRSGLRDFLRGVRSAGGTVVETEGEDEHMA